jgi:hypothetical protein
MKGVDRQPLTPFLVRCDLSVRQVLRRYFLLLGRSHTPAGGMYGLSKCTTSALTSPQIRYCIVQMSSPTYHLVSFRYPLQIDYFM